MGSEANAIDQEYWNLKIFCTVVEEQSVSLAAQRLVLGQPAVSMAIRRMERRWGANFLKRQGTRTVLTDAGAAFYQHALSTLRSARNLDTKIRAHRSGAPGLLVFATRSSLAAHYLPPILAEFWRERPQVEIRVVNLYPHVVMVKDALDEGAEFAVVPRGRGIVDADLAMEIFHREPVVLIASAKHRLARRDSVSLEELAREPFIVSSLEASHVVRVQEALAARGLPFQVAIEIEGEGARSLVRAGVGISVALHCTVRHELDRGELRCIEIPGLDLSMDLVLVYRPDAAFSPPAQRMLELIREHGTLGEGRVLAGSSITHS